MSSRSTLGAFIALFLTFALIAAACGDDDDDATGTDGAVDSAGVADGAAEALPGEGVSINMARANWSTGYFQAEVYKALLQELGYEVSDLVDNELGPANFYPALAIGDYDLWANGWFPSHSDAFFDGEVPGGGTVSDRVAIIGLQVDQGALQGFLIDRATAEAEGIESLDQIGNDPDLAALFDANGDGLADIFACNDGWGCQDVIERTLDQNGWNGVTINQLSGSYDALFADAVARVAEGRPTLAYTWTPSAYITQLIPGDNVLWLGVESPIAEQAGASTLGPEMCTLQPCEMGFVAADIQAVANNDFLEANPGVRVLLEQVRISVTDIALQNVDMQNGEDSQADIVGHAAEWIESNRSMVDEWLSAARAAA